MVSGKQIFHRRFLGLQVKTYIDILNKMIDFDDIFKKD